MEVTPTNHRRRAFLRACLSVPAIVLAACTNQQSIAPTAVPTIPEAPTAAPVAEAPTTAPTSVAPSTEAPTAAAPTAESSPAALQPTPACDDDDEPTPAQTEGPYFTPSSPERSSLIEGNAVGTPILLSGIVLDTACRPVARALLDFWHADDAGNYDNVGYTFRGHVYSDDSGRFTLTTIVPGSYPGRTRHYHVKVQAPNGPILTTQLYFPDEPDNARDGIYRPELELQVSDGNNGKQGTFTFVLVTA